MGVATSFGTATGALGRLFALWVLGCAIAVADPCVPPAAPTPAQVHRVVDGDTLQLVGGERVRLSGIDAPERGRDGAVDQPYAAAAHAHLRTLVELGGGRVGLATGTVPRDRYGRLLATVHTDRHGDLAAHLVENGLALVAPIPPDLDALACHRAAEHRARGARVGLWSGVGAVTHATDIARTGFAVVRGTGSGWTIRHDDRLLVLDDRLVIRVRNADAVRWFAEVDFDAYAGREIEVRGWVHPWRGGSRAITVQHPAAIVVAGE